MSSSQQVSGNAAGPSSGNVLGPGFSSLNLGTSGRTHMRGVNPLSRMSPIPQDFDPQLTSALRAWDPCHPDAQVERAVKIRACLDLTSVIATIPQTYRGILSDKFAAYMVDLDRVSTLRRTIAKLEGFQKRGEFPHSYNSVKAPTFQFQRGVKDLWETNWNLPVTKGVLDFKNLCLTNELLTRHAELQRVNDVSEERAVIQVCFNACADKHIERAASGVLNLTVDNNSVLNFSESTYKPAEDEFQALQVDLPVYVRKVYDLKLDQIERAATTLAKKEGKKQEKRDLDIDMQDAAAPNTPETKMTINQLVNRAIDARLKKQSQAPSNKKVGDHLLGSLNSELMFPIATRYPEQWYEEDACSASCPPKGTEGQEAGQEEQDHSVAEGYCHREEEEPGSWRRQQAAQAWERRERQRQTSRSVGDILSKPWTFGIPSSYPDEILTLPRSIQISTLLSRAPVTALEANRFRGLVHVQSGVVVPVTIQHDLSASLKFMFEQRINGSKILEAYTDLKRRIRWKWYFLDQVGDEYDPDYEVPVSEESKKKEPPRASSHIERGLAAGQDYVDTVIRSIPESKRKADSLVSVNTKRARDFMATNNLIVTSTDKNLGVAVFKLEWIVHQADALFSNVDDYSHVYASVAMERLSEIARKVDELCDIHLGDKEQLSKFMSHCVPDARDRSEWDSWKPYVPEAYAIPKIHKNPWKGRPICPGYCLPQNPASKVLSKITRPFIDNLPWVIQGSKDFVRKLADIKIPVGRKAWIVSADVVNFYPSVDVDLLRRILNEFADEILVPEELQKGLITLPQRERRIDYYERLFDIALEPPVMTFLSKILVQQKGLPMGAAGSPDAANMFGAYHERNWIQRYINDPDVLFYGRYLDDIFTLVLAETADEAVERVSYITLGSVKLLWEPPSDTANFLDLSVSIQEDGSIHHTPFVKAMSHRERIPWSSAHPLDVKRGTFSSEISRLATLCSDKKDYFTECADAVSLYVGRGYPPKLVTLWLKKQQEQRWENRLSTKEGAEEPTHTLFTLKTSFNNTWKSFNVEELESKIKAQWSEGLTPTVLGKRKHQHGLRPIQKVRLVVPRTNVSGQTRISFVRDDDSGAALEPVLARPTGSVLGLMAQQDVLKWTGLWIDTGKFLVSRRKTTQLWDLTRKWNEQLWNNVMLEEGLKRPFDPSYAWITPSYEGEQ